MENELSLFTGVVLSLALSYVPGLAPKFAVLDGVQKRLVVLGVLAGAALIVFGAGCAGIDLPGVSEVACNRDGAGDLFSAFLSAVIGSQAAYLITPKK